MLPLVWMSPALPFGSRLTRLIHSTVHHPPTAVHCYCPLNPFPRPLIWLTVLLKIPIGSLSLTLTETTVGLDVVR